MSPHRSMRVRALRQAAALAALLAVAAVAIVLVNRQPADADALHAEVSVVRSQAADAVLLMRARAGLPARFVRAQAEQAHKNVLREHDRIAQLDVAAGLEAAKERVVQAADHLARALTQVPSGGVEASVPEALRAELERIERTLTPSRERS